MKCKLIDAKNPIWDNAEQTHVNVEAKWEHIKDLGYLPFSATSTDLEEHGVDLFNRCVAGEFGSIGEYIAPVIIEEEIIEEEIIEEDITE